MGTKELLKQTGFAPVVNSKSRISKSLEFRAQPGVEKER